MTTPSNLALDNILLRLHLLAQSPPYSTLLPPGSILRLGHPTRVHRDLISQTLDWRAGNGDEGSLVRDVGKEIEDHLGDLGRKKGERGSVRGKERGQKWQEVRELRKECVILVCKGRRKDQRSCSGIGKERRKSFGTSSLQLG